MKDFQDDRYAVLDLGLVIHAADVAQPKFTALNNSHCAFCARIMHESSFAGFELSHSLNHVWREQGMQQPRRLYHFDYVSICLILRHVHPEISVYFTAIR